jgi:hypothetical protein
MIDGTIFLINRHRGSNKKLSQKVQWGEVSHDPTREVIFCYHEKQNENPDWNNVVDYVKKRTKRYWLKPIDGRQAIFVRMASGTRIQNTARKQAERTGLCTVTGSILPIGLYSSFPIKSVGLLLLKGNLRLI